MSEPTSMPYAWRAQQEARPSRLPRRALPTAVLTVLTCGGGCILVLLDAYLRL